MLDVHPPHHTANTWRDFFIHIATIVVGLLIAIGLEQTVEALHRHHQREKLLESLHSDLKRIVLDTSQVDKMTVGNLQYLRTRSAQVSASLKGNTLPEPPMPRPIASNTPTFPAWQAARSAGEISVLSDEDIKAFSEVDETLEHTQRDIIQSSNDLLQVGTYILTQGGIDSETLDLTKLSQAQKLEFLKLILQAYQSVGGLQSMERQLRGAATAIDNGERDLDRISHLERQVASTP